MKNSIQSRLLKWAALFLGSYATILTLAPTVYERNLNAELRWGHWGGLFAWLMLTLMAHNATQRHLPDRDPYLLAITSLLSGWGLLTIWQLSSSFGLRQIIWLGISIAVLLIGVRLKNLLPTLRRYKYLWLTTGLFLTALTLIFGSNPAGSGARLWLGFSGVFLQPSEPLKLFLIIYLAAYLADRTPFRGGTFSLLYPTLLLTGFALVLLLIQRDLGTASIFIILFTLVLYLATDRKVILLLSAGALALSSIIGYYLIDIIHLRIIAWFDPWADPSGRGYQVIQSLMAIANGGLLGRGPGLGSPEFVPVAHSDFIFSALAEQTGLVGTIGLLTLIGILLARGLRIALHASNGFHRLLAGGLTAYLGVQSLLIIGGNLRLLPLTGVTLPFISYGGSSLLTSYVALLILLLISNETDEPAPLSAPQPYLVLGGLLGLGLVAAALVNGWWAIVRGPDLLSRSDNPRRAQSDLYVPRGAIIDRDNNPINSTTGETGDFLREYLYPDLAPIAGYTHPIYGQAGLEAELDDYLRGLAGNPDALIWWNQLLYGQPPPGLDVRLSLDLALQRRADEALGNHAGAIILLNAESGEILAMASHPTFDANLLGETAENLIVDHTSPLLNRATLGQYPISAEIEVLFDLPTTPTLRLPIAVANEGYATPLQMALVAAALSNNGLAPAPRIALAVNTSQSGWIILPALGKQIDLFALIETEQLLTTFVNDKQPSWQHISITKANEATVTWLLAGTTSDWGGTPLALVVLLEENNPALAKQIAQGLLSISP